VDSASRLRPVLFDVTAEEVLPQKLDMDEDLRCTSRPPAEPMQCLLCVKWYGTQHHSYHSCQPTSKCGDCGAIGTILRQALSMQALLRSIFEDALALATSLRALHCPWDYWQHGCRKGLHKVQRGETCLLYLQQVRRLWHQRQRVQDHEFLPLCS